MVGAVCWVPIGTGTFGRVCLAQSSATERWYALKVLRKEDVVRLKQVEHVIAEKNILASVTHPFIVNMVNSFKDDDNLYMLMEFVCGGELFTHLRRAGRFHNDVAKFYASCIVLVFEYLHDNNIVYRDLKPENVLLDEKGYVKVTDFGFAKKVVDRTWTLCGTPEYIAPEIIQSKGHNKAVDWWSLGILIYEMLAGYPPFYDDNPFGIYEKILVGRFSFPSHFDVQARDLVRRLLTADRTKRLGNLKKGARDVENHRWFRRVDWNALLERTIDAPIIPPYKYPGDAGNYDDYEDEEVDTSSSGEDFGELFDDF
eukprot:TRINITY_DN3056_c1_g2_i4.p1 TRINITY_DN3056_c1_g2~~TRINITY_DN3056_c1_g2_i4.p1  ORF type:complete len:313 (+),score=51.77 TRINITY_DN3056_c1_g2_i4:98-1036(+)